MQDGWLDLCKGARCFVQRASALLCCPATAYSWELHHTMTGDVFCAQSFAIFGGVYAFASCMVQRIRAKQDGEGQSARSLSLLAGA